MKTIRFTTLTVLFMAFALLSACSNYKEIQAGFVGRVLTPTGWEKNVRESGQVDLGKKSWNGAYNALVLLEATSTTVKEQFMQAEMSPDKQDHRILTKDGVPLAVDVYIRAIIPDDEVGRNNIFVQVTPRDDKKDPLVRWIMVEDVYERFAQMDVRSKVRGIFAKYKDYNMVYSNYERISDEIAAMVAKTFKENGVPLKLQNVSLSNVKPDETLWAAQNKSASAQAEVDAINKIGEALRNNPQYREFLKWRSLEKITENGSKSGTNTVIIVDSDDRGMASSFAAAEHLRTQLSPAKQTKQKQPEDPKKQE